VVFSGLLANQRIDAPAAVNPIVDATGVKDSQDLDHVLARHLSHERPKFPTIPDRCERVVVPKMPAQRVATALLAPGR
jgi:hypothetical protein